jgi:hypothetical protein
MIMCPMMAISAGGNDLRKENVERFIGVIEQVVN